MDAIKGGSVCRVHGGSAPQVRAAAKQRLLEMVNPALAALSQVLKQKKDHKARVSASNSVLDRAGFKPTDKFEFAGFIETQSDIDLTRLTGDQLATLAGLLAAAARTDKSGAGEESEEQDSAVLPGDGTATP